MKECHCHILHISNRIHKNELQNLFPEKNVSCYPKLSDIVDCIVN